MMTTSSTLPVAHSLTGEWRRFASFLRRPVLPARAAGPNRKTLTATGRLLLLDYAVMAVLLAIGGLAMLGGLEFPENELEGIDWNLGWVATVVLAAPIYEELGFRSWLSGRIGHFGFVAGAIPTYILVFYFDLGNLDPALKQSLAIVFSIMVGMVTGLIGLFVAPKSKPLTFFAAWFPLFFWGSALLFASIHLFNYQDDFHPALLALVVPQFIAGTIFGYARVQYGLWSSILLHMLHNGTALSLALLTADLVG